MAKKPNSKSLEDDEILDDDVYDMGDSDENDFDTEIEVDDDDDDNMDIVIEVDDNDDDKMDIVIEVDDDDDDDDVEDNDDSNKDAVLSKHKVEGKHSLKYDSIFKGKKEETLDENEYYSDNFTNFNKDTIEIDKTSTYHQESMNNEAYIRGKQVKEKVYKVLKEHTNINFMNNRRKPSRVDFNNYYELLKTNLKQESFTNVELFNELSVYFSDNLFNMFKLLDNKWRNMIILELQDHIGKNNQSKEIQNRNIYEGTEIEFQWIDNLGEEMIITGVVLETDYPNSSYKVDSYENIYQVSLSNITKILNNTKFKYNLNRLNHIDFL